MNIILYTIHCPACNVLRKKLEAAKLPFTIVDDLAVLEEKNMRQFPILEVDGNFYSYGDAVKFVNSCNE